MWTPLITLCLLVLLTLVAAAGWVALFVSDHRRATRALGILKAVLAATVGGGGVFALMLRLHEAGLI